MLLGDEIMLQVGYECSNELKVYSESKIEGKGLGQLIKLGFMIAKM
jgi:hypothetical protein